MKQFNYKRPNASLKQQDSGQKTMSHWYYINFVQIWMNFVILGHLFISIIILKTGLTPIAFIKLDICM